jgi:hypothetical protein
VTEAPAAPAAVAIAVDDAPVVLDDVILAWGDVLPQLPPSSRRAIQDFQPIDVDGDVVVFGISPRLLDAAKPRFHREAHTIRAELTSRLGRNVRFKLIGHEGFTAVNASQAGGEALATAAAPEPAPPRRRPVTVASAPAPEAEEPPLGEPPIELEDEIDLTELRDAPAATAVDSISRLQERFGASVVEELPRD